MQQQMEQRRQMFSMIEEWKHSGQSQMAFCREKSIGYHVFHYWYKRYRSEHPENASSPFVPLQIEPHSPTCMELIMPNGKRLLLPANTTVQTLLTLLA